MTLVFSSYNRILGFKKLTSRAITTTELYLCSQANPIDKVLDEYNIKKDGAVAQPRKKTTAPDCHPRPADGGTR